MSGTENISPPTVSPAAANNDSVPADRRSPARTIRENVHTNILGRDAGDSYANTSSTEINTSSVTNSSETNATKDDKKRWWGSPGLFKGNNDNENENDKTNSSNNMNRKRRNNNARYDGLQQSSALEDGTHYDPPPLSSTTAGSVSSSSVGTNSLGTEEPGTAAVTREDSIRANATYFYRGSDDDPSAPKHKTRSHRGTGRTIKAANSLLQRMSVRARLSGQVDGALFMSRYERLNHVNNSPRRRHKALHQRGQQYTGNDNSSNNNQDIIEDNHELFLDEENELDEQQSSYREHIPSPTNNVVMGATSLANPHGVRSSMFFEQDGKMLMRLPRDQVRLVMDYNLEPGILSVEQWRSKDDAEAASEKLAKQNAQTRFSMQRDRQRERRRRQREKERRRRVRKRKKREKQQKLETEEKKEQQRDIENPNEEGDNYNNNDDDDDDDDSSYSSYSDDDDSYFDDDLDDAPEDLLPALNYVITIPDDMYRRMVGEIADKVFPPYWGFFKCCNQESEPASIKLALLILSVVMTLLFIGSLEWRTT